MDSLKSGPTQQDVGQRPAFRVKLRVARVKVTYPSGLKSYSTLRVARLLAVQEGRNGPHGRTLRALGLEP